MSRMLDAQASQDAALWDCTMFCNVLHVSVAVVGRIVTEGLRRPSAGPGRLRAMVTGCTRRARRAEVIPQSVLDVLAKASSNVWSLCEASVHFSFSSFRVH